MMVVRHKVLSKIMLRNAKISYKNIYFVIIVLSKNILLSNSQRYLYLSLYYLIEVFRDCKKIALNVLGICIYLRIYLN